MPYLPKAWDGLTILHVSDLHLCGSPDLAFFQSVMDRCGGLGAGLGRGDGDIVDSAPPPRVDRAGFQPFALGAMGAYAIWEPRFLERSGGNRRRSRAAWPARFGHSWEHTRYAASRLSESARPCSSDAQRQSRAAMKATPRPMGLGAAQACDRRFERSLVRPRTTCGPDYDKRLARIAVCLQELPKRAAKPARDGGVFLHFVQESWFPELHSAIAPAKRLKPARSTRGGARYPTISPSRAPSPAPKPRSDPRRFERTPNRASRTNADRSRADGQAVPGFRK